MALFQMGISFVKELVEQLCDGGKWREGWNSVVSSINQFVILSKYVHYVDSFLLLLWIFLLFFVCMLMMGLYETVL